MRFVFGEASPVLDAIICEVGISVGGGLEVKDSRRRRRVLGGRVVVLAVEWGPPLVDLRWRRTLSGGMVELTVLALPSFALLLACRASGVNGIFARGIVHPPPAVRCRPGLQVGTNLTSVVMSSESDSA